RAAALVGHARDVDDDAAALLQHVRQHFLHPIERALDVEVVGQLEQVVVDFEKSAATQRRPGRIEQEIDASEALDAGLDEGLHRSALGDVGLHEGGFAALGLDEPYRLLAALDI